MRCTCLLLGLEGLLLFVELFLLLFRFLVVQRIRAGYEEVD